MPVASASPSWSRVDTGLVRTLPRASFNEHLIGLHRGRYYPSKLLSVEAPARMFRASAVTETEFTADFNAPLAYFDIDWKDEVIDTPVPAVGNVDALIRFAGMEAPLADGETDFGDAEGFERPDAGDDREFYRRPRRIMHVDVVCHSRICALYAEYLAPGARVLDLMAGWRSHLPPDLGPVSGLGMNEEELADNPELQDYRVHDLNRSANLPYEDASFDAVVNTVSIEYLVDPVAVLREVRRVLRPGGMLLVSFSNRYFPPKVIRLWTRMLPMERLGMVLQWMDQAGFVDLAVQSERGLERDPRDRYTAQLREMDPLFAAWGRAPGR
jgi:SAM-dependent methyltransferase